MKRSRVGLSVAAAAVLVVAGAPFASAHVTVTSDSTSQGSGASLTFRVPSERADASTTAVEIDFPTDHPLSGVSVLSKPGWTFEVTKAVASQSSPGTAAPGTASPTSSPTPSSSATPSMASMPGMDMGGMNMSGSGMHGNAFLRAPATDDDDDAGPQTIVTSITWHINSAGSAIPSDGYDLFTVRVAKLPTDTDTLTFRAVQTYSSGEVVRWIDQAAPGTAEPEHPAPTLHLTAAGAAMPAMSTPSTSAPTGGMTMTTTPMGGMQMEMGPSRDDTVNVALGLGIAGLFLGLVAGTLGGAALARARGKGKD